MYLPQKAIIFAATQILGALTVIFILSGILKGSGSDYMKWHPVLMTLSMVYFMGSSITMYRGLSWMEKFHLKVIHACTHCAGLICAIIGVILVFQEKNGNGNLISFHGIFGLIGVIIFGLQWISGLLLYLYPKAPLSIRAGAMPHHVSVGIMVFLMGAMTVLTGVNGKSFGNSTSNVLFKFSGFTCFLFTILVVYFVSKEKFKRDSSLDEKS